MAIGQRLAALVTRLTAPPSAPSPWRPAHAAYPRLAAAAAPEPAGTAGLVAIWHLGVRPQWLKVAAVRDIAAAVRSAAAQAAIISYRPNGGVYVAWAPLPLAALPAAAAHLRARLAPAVQALTLDGEIAVPASTAPAPFPLPPDTTA